MLVLSRRIGETIVVGENVAVTVTAIVGDKVRLGVTAPRGVSVHRDEVYEEIHGEGSVETIFGVFPIGVQR